MTTLSVLLTYCSAVIRTRIEDQRGAAVIEYALLASLIAVVCIGAMSMVGGVTSTSFSRTSSKLP